MKITLLGDLIKTEQDFHKALAEQLNFGVHYGHNLNALWDRMTADVERPVEVIWRDSELSKTALGEELFNKIVQLLRDVETQDKADGLSEPFKFWIE